MVNGEVVGDLILRPDIVAAISHRTPFLTSLTAGQIHWSQGFGPTQEEAIADACMVVRMPCRRSCKSTG